MQAELDAFLRQQAGTIGPFEIAAYINDQDAIPRSPTGRHFPAAGGSGEQMSTKAERATPSSPSAPPPPVPPEPSLASVPTRAPPQVPRGPSRSSAPREQAPAREDSRAALRESSAQVKALTAKVKALIDEVPPERRPFLYGGAGVVGLLLAVLVLFNVCGGDESFGGQSVLVVDSEPPGLIKVNEREMGKTPKKLTGLPSGAVVVEVYDPDLPFSKKQLMTLSPGDNGAKRIIVSREMVELDVYPRAKVTIDGQVKGMTPLAPIQLYEGRHRIQLAYEGTSVETDSEFEVRAGERNVVKKNLGR